MPYKHIAIAPAITIAAPATPALTFAAAPVYIAGMLEVAFGIPVAVLLPAPSAAQLVKFCPPKNVPTVTASVMCSILRTELATVAFVAQKLIV